MILESGTKNFWAILRREVTEAYLGAFAFPIYGIEGGSLLPKGSDVVRPVGIEDIDLIKLVRFVSIVVCPEIDQEVQRRTLLVGEKR